MASIRKKHLSDGRIVFQAIWREGAGADRRQRTKNFDRHAEARTFAAKMEREVEQRRVGDPDRATVAEFLENWLGYLDAQDELSVTTRAGYRRYVKLAIRELGEIPLERLRARDLDLAYARLRAQGGAPRSTLAKAAGTTRPLAARSILHLHRVLHSRLRAGAQMEAHRREPGARCLAAFARKVTREGVHRRAGEPSARRGRALRSGTVSRDRLPARLRNAPQRAARACLRLRRSRRRAASPSAAAVVETTYLEPMLREHGKTEVVAAHASRSLRP